MCDANPLRIIHGPAAVYVVVAAAGEVVNWKEYTLQDMWSR